MKLHKEAREGIPEGLWLRCPDCGDMLFRKVVEEALHVCPNCQYHFRISARTRVEQIVGPRQFEEQFADVEPTDPIEFVDKKSYADRLDVRAGEDRQPRRGRLRPRVRQGPAAADGGDGPDLHDGLDGERRRREDHPHDRGRGRAKTPLLIVSCSGGARMQESTLSLMQMAKTSRRPGEAGRGEGAVHLAAGRPDDRRRHRELRDARRLHPRRAQGPDRLRRPADDLRTRSRSNCPKGSSGPSSSRSTASSISSSTAKTCEARSPG